MAYEHENTIYSGYGEFMDTPDWTEAEWANYNAQIAEEMRLADEHEEQMLYLQAEYEADAYMAQYDDDPNPYHGDYSEM